MTNKKILVIDDDPGIIESINAVLSSEGYTVVTAAEGRIGVEKFRSEKPDMVICDMMMETIDAGSRTAEIIRKEDSRIPVYLMSTIGNATAYNINIYDLGFNGVFQKPVNPDSLITSIKKVFSSK